MKIVQKVALFAVLLISGFQIDAKNKDRIFVINKFGEKLTMSHMETPGQAMTLSSPLAKGESVCVSVSKEKSSFKDIGMKPMPHYKGIRHPLQITKSVKNDNIVVADKNAKKDLRVTVYKNYAEFIAAYPDYQLDPEVSCPHVLP